MNFKIDIEELLDLTLTEVKDKITHHYKCPLKDLKFMDLLVNENTNKAMRHGVYMFFDDADEPNCVYVGMCSSSHFAHRLGGHFGMSPKYGMNNFLRGVVKQLHEEHTYSDYVRTIKEIGGYSYLMIAVNPSEKRKELKWNGIKEKQALIRKLEKLFHAIYVPKLNKPKRNGRMKKRNANLADKGALIFRDLINKKI